MHMKKFAVILLAALAALPSYAQNKKALKAENERLKTELDASRARLDSLEARLLEMESAAAAEASSLPAGMTLKIRMHEDIAAHKGYLADIRSQPPEYLVRLKAPSPKTAVQEDRPVGRELNGTPHKRPQGDIHSALQMLAGELHARAHIHYVYVFPRGYIGPCIPGFHSRLRHETRSPFPGVGMKKRGLSRRQKDDGRDAQYRIAGKIHCACHGTRRKWNVFRSFRLKT